MLSNMPNDFIDDYQDKKPLLLKNVLMLVV